MADDAWMRAQELQRQADQKAQELHRLQQEIDREAQEANRIADDKRTQARRLEVQAGDANKDSGERAAILAVAYRQFSEAEDTKQHAGEDIDRKRNTIKQLEREIMDLESQARKLRAEAPGSSPI